MAITKSWDDSANAARRPASSVDGEQRARRIVERLGGVWRGTAGLCRCPAHDDRTPSLSVRLGERAILFHCFAGCATTDVLNALHRAGLNDRLPLVMSVAAPKDDHTYLARRLWRSSVAMAGSPVETYLKVRAVTLQSTKLRFNQCTIFGTNKTKQTMPAMIAAVETDLGVVAVQRTFLDLHQITRRPMRRSKVALGRMGGGAIRLAAATTVLGIAEGIEDAMSAMEWFGTPTWAAGGVERLASIDIPAQVKHIILYGDRGEAAARGLERARAHLTMSGRTLELRLPDHHADWNDAWRALKRE